MHSDHIIPGSESGQAGPDGAADARNAPASDGKERPRLFGQRMPPMWLARVHGHWKRKIAWHVLAAAVVATSALLLFAKIGEDVFEHESGSFDAAVRSWMLARQTPALFRVFTWITNAGSSASIVAMTLAVCLWLWRFKGRHAASGAIVAPLVAVALYNGVKMFFGRIRPVGALHFRLHSYAFPSGHATVSMTAAVTVAYVMWRERFVGARTALVIACGVPLLVGFSRTYLDVHWATDVLGGWCVGLFVAAVAIAVYERLRRDPEVSVVEGLTAQSTSPGDAAL